MRKAIKNGGSNLRADNDRHSDKFSIIPQHDKKPRTYPAENTAKLTCDMGLNNIGRAYSPESAALKIRGDRHTMSNRNGFPRFTFDLQKR
jgi:hypothetical protein